MGRLDDDGKFAEKAVEGHRNFYGRRHGKSLKPIHRKWLQEDLDVLSPGPVSPSDNPERTHLDLVARFGHRPVWLEIGFGSGEHLVHQATRQPDVTVLGAEPFINGVATLLGRIRADDIRNVAVYPADARDLFDVLPSGSIAKAFLLYPDPWPKRRHHRRRFVTPGHLRPLARVLAPGAEFRIVSDIQSYITQALREVPSAGFVRLDREMQRPWDDWLPTRYERKALREGRRPSYLTFLRSDCATTV